MVRVGLSGKSFIPLLSSFACAIPAVMATRVIENRRDRLTTILIAPLMSCRARLPVYTLMIAAFIPERQFVGGLIGLQGLVLFSMYLLGILIGAAVALLLKRTCSAARPRRSSWRCPLTSGRRRAWFCTGCSIAAGISCATRARSSSPCRS